MENKKQSDAVIIFKTTSKIKEAVIKAAANTGKVNISNFIRTLLENNKEIKKYL